MKKILLISTFMFFGISSIARASVYINEIAWMGTSVSSTNEWIELFNDGQDSVDLSGWKIISVDGGLTINLSGNINSGGYYLIERTDDDTVLNIVADLVAPFGSGFSNSGEDLILKDSIGNTIDTLSFSSGWPAGDNTTKETMQKSNGSWISAQPTPKAINSGVSSNQNTNTSPSGGTQSSSTTEKKETIKKEVVPTIKMSISTPKRKVLTHIKTIFSPEIIGLSGEKVSYGYFVWSMGDGNSYVDRQLKKVEHTYNTVGTYAVTLSYFENSWTEDSISEITIPIEVINPQIEIKKLSDGSIEFSNRSNEDISISNWKVINEDKTYIFPKGMIIFSNKNIIISKNILGFSANEKTFISYPNGQILSLNDVEDQKPLVVTNIKKIYITENIETKNDVIEDIISVQKLDNKINEDIEAVDLTANSLNSTKSSSTKYFIFAGGIIMIMSLFTYLLFFRKSNIENKDEFDEYELVDE